MTLALLADDFPQADTPHERRALQKIATVSRQCTRLEQLLDDFLRFARLRQLDLRAGNINDQIERVLDLFEPLARENGVEVVRYLDPDLPSTLLHPETLQAALVNLVKNALEAMPNGGRLVVRTRMTRGGVARDMIDDGCGMDEKTLFRMFDAFYSTKERGTGLGLPLTQQIMLAHRGSVRCDDRPGGGAIFRLAFPAAEPGTA